MSLSFVVAALLEFAFVLMVRNRFKTSDWKGQKVRKNKTAHSSNQPRGGVGENNGSNLQEADKNRRAPFHWTGLSTDAIDRVASVLFLSSYLIFNLVYWLGKK